MAWVEYLIDSLKRIFLKKSISDFENETENGEEGYDSRFNDSTSEERGINIKTYYENWENQTFESLLQEHGCVELKLLINNNEISESFSFCNIGINYSITKTADFNFRYRSISVLPKYRERGVCSYLLLKSIIVVLETLENNHLLNSRQAQGVIATALGRVSELEQELEISPVTSLDKIAEDFDFASVEKVFPSRLSKKAKKGIVKALLEFPDTERENLLEFALELSKQNKARKVNYLIFVLNDWVIEGVQTKGQAVAYHEQNFGEVLPDVSDEDISEDFRSAMDLWKD